MNSSGTITATNTCGPAGLISRHTSTGSTFYEFDPQGTVVQRLNSAGSNTITSTADAFGNVANSGTVSDPFGYEAQAGYYTDQSTGLILTTFRYYDPVNGRFLNRDPVGNLGGVNSYGYCQNEPVSYADPSGCKRTCEDILKDMYETLDEFWDRWHDLREDRLNLWGYQDWPKGKNPSMPGAGSYQGHITQEEGIQNRLDNLYAEFMDSGCFRLGFRIPRRYTWAMNKRIPTQPAVPGPIVEPPPAGSNQLNGAPGPNSNCGQEILEGAAEAAAG